jgi:hypothetical protein
MDDNRATVVQLRAEKDAAHEVVVAARERVEVAERELEETTRKLEVQVKVARERAEVAERKLEETTHKLELAERVAAPAAGAAGTLYDSMRRDDWGAPMIESKSNSDEVVDKSSDGPSGMDPDGIIGMDPDGIIESNWDEVVDNFDDMGLREELLRGIKTSGFEKPTAVQQRAIVPIIKGHDVIVQSGNLLSGRTAAVCIGALQKIDTGLRQCQVLVLTPTRELAQCIQKVSLAAPLSWHHDRAILLRIVIMPPPCSDFCGIHAR